MNIKTIVVVCFFIYLASLLTARVAYNQTIVSNVKISANTHATETDVGYLEYVLAAIVGFSLLLIIFGKRALFRKALAAYFFVLLLFLTFLLASIFTFWLSFWVGLGFALACCAIVGYLYIMKRIEFFNLFGVIIAVSAPIIFGFDLSLLTVVILLIIFAVYDLIAVFVTKHMQVLAKITLSEGTPIPAMFVFGKFEDMKKRMTSVGCLNCGDMMTIKGVIGTCKRCGRKVKIIGGKKIVVLKKGNASITKLPKGTYGLGLGDIIIPAIFPISLMVKFGMFKAILAVIGATIGVGLNLYIVKKKNIILPALPLIIMSMLLMSLM